ncbi:MAG: hypothetical protein ACI9MF_002906, partial [Gammaproteobacteria bacterium]
VGNPTDMANIKKTCLIFLFIPVRVPPGHNV